LQTVEDLFYRLPFRYEDRSRMQPIVSLRPGAKAAVLGEIKSARLSITRRRGFKIFNAVVSDASGAIRCTWMNQAFLADILHPRSTVVMFGEVKLDSSGLHFMNPEYELVGDDLAGVHTARIVPFYEKTGTVTPNTQRRLVRQALDELPALVPDLLPADLRDRLGLVPRRVAMEQAHFPANEASVDALNAFRTAPQRRMIFEELFLFQVGHAWRRHATSIELKPHVPAVDDRIRASAAKVLPFKLTPGQRQAVKEIVDDMRLARPMHRLLQGDVGAGKTIVALLAAVVAMENGLQVAFMAPTEILAAQHYATIAKLLAQSRFRVDLLTGSTPGLHKHTLLAHIERGTTNLIVGTHALVQETVRFNRLGLVVIDEQHRFGVVQRARLREKGLRPDVLLMTATPIPRTLALTDYSELDVSKIADLPPGRKPVRTWVKPESRRDEIYRIIRDELDAGRQAYIIYPLVEESEKIDLKSATEMADHLQQDVFPAYRVALLHGRMKQDAKDRVMQAFATGQVHILVSTTVVEVGVDVPNATVMVVEHAERFGLSQLHQLRGRIGRGAHASHCILLYQAPWTDDARERLKVMSETTDGFAIAEKDLELRGPGDFFGTRQSGLPKLRTGDLVRDRDIMEEAHREARRIVDEEKLTRELQEFVQTRWQDQFGLIEVG
ncbi:MAG: ATP-dependent DNA helicase RecG, partial [Vicinamibacterales bacterium]